MGRVSLARTLVCLWVLWQMFYVGGEQKFVRLEADLTGSACAARVQAIAPYERRPGLVRYLQDITPEARMAHPTGVWYGCFPAEVDPDPKAP